MRYVFLTLLATSIVACSSTNSSSSGDGGTGITAGTSADTAGTQDGTDGTVATDGTDGQSTADGGDGDQPPQPCTSNEDCANGVCNCLGQCVAPGVEGLPACVENINCGSGHYCDQCAKVCRKLKTLCEPCQKSEECDGGSCLDFASGGRFCLLDCVADPGCPQPGYKCETISGVTYKQCKPLSGGCEQPELCTTDTDCPFGDICKNGTCGPGCTPEAGCADGKVCSAFRCKEKCGPNNPCPEGQECQETGHCWVKGGCLEPKHCDTPETYCDVKEKLCKPGCLEDFDCKSSGKICKDGKCVTKGCTANYTCAFGQECDLATGQCKAAEGPHCKTGCDAQQPETSCGEGNMCLQLEDKDGNKQGPFCFVGCKGDPNNKCPQGYQCEQLKDENGAVKAELCFRDCTFQPI